MRIQSFVVLGLCMLLCKGVHSQFMPAEPDLNKPLMFSSVHDSIPVNIDKLNELLALNPGSAVRLNLGTTIQLSFDGSVTSRISKYENTIQSVDIRSTNFPGAVLNINRTIASPGAIPSYTARIISRAHGDLLELKLVNGVYIFKKKKYYELINE